MIANRFYLDGKGRTESDVCWDILTGKFDNTPNVEMSNPQKY